MIATSQFEHNDKFLPNLEKFTSKQHGKHPPVPWREILFLADAQTIAETWKVVGGQGESQDINISSQSKAMKTRIFCQIQTNTLFMI